MEDTGLLPSLDLVTEAYTDSTLYHGVMT